MNTTYKELSFEMWRMLEKQIYFQMSAAGAGMGYALATIDKSISTPQSRILLLALFIWALSFWFGSRAVSKLTNLVGIGRMLTEDLILSFDLPADQSEQAKSDIEKAVNNINGPV